jgi:hypothetical protein
MVWLQSGQRARVQQRGDARRHHVLSSGASSGFRTCRSVPGHFVGGIFGVVMIAVFA